MRNLSLAISRPHHRQLGDCMFPNNGHETGNTQTSPPRSMSQGRICTRLAGLHAGEPLQPHHIRDDFR
jgi:hypothetical protein